MLEWIEALRTGWLVAYCSVPWWKL